MKPNITEAVAPVRLSVMVRASRPRAFQVFSERIGDWWPSATHSISGGAVATIVMECREGGRILERHKDGGEAPWGVIRKWDPPERLVFSWNPSYEARPETEVEVSFIAVSETETRVELEHRDWGALGEPGRAMRDHYEQGWPVVMDNFVEFASA
jgi:uncharacterized protein YndB with AHSA1/START domain